MRQAVEQPDMDGVLLHRTLDLHTLALACSLAGRLAMPARGWTADGIFEACGLGPEPKPHTALTGARMTASALRVMSALLANDDDDDDDPSSATRLGEGQK
jgi:hypothetical protein